MSKTRQVGCKVSGWAEDSNLLSLQEWSTKLELEISMARLRDTDPTDEARKHRVHIASQAYQEARQRLQAVSKDQVLIPPSMDLPAAARSVSRCHHHFQRDLQLGRRHVV